MVNDFVIYTMVCKFWIDFLIIFLLNAQYVASQMRDPLERLKAVHKVRYITLDKRGVPTWLEGILTPKNFKGNALEIVYCFFEENKELYKLEDPAIELRVIRDGSHGEAIRLQQYKDGAKVEEGVLRVSFDNHWELHEIRGRLQPVTISTTPTISQETAKEIMVNDLQKDNKSSIPKVYEQELVIHSFQDSVYLAWYFTASVTPFGDSREYYIDAHNGKIIDFRSTIKH
jgi:Zn-dependent metalloprotease